MAVLEPFFVGTWSLIILGQLLASWGFFWSGWLLTGFLTFVNIKWVFWPAFWTWLSVPDVEALTFKYYQTVKKHRLPSHPVIQVYAGAKVDWIVSRLPLEGKTILDVGGGCGYFAQFLTKYSPQTHIVDNSQEQLRMNTLPEDQKHLGTCYKMPFPDGQYDVVFVSNLLHHLNHPEVAMREIARVAKTYVVVVEASNANPVMRLGALVAAHESRARFHSREVVEKLITDAGLRVTHHTYQGGMVLPNRSAPWTLRISMPTTFNSYVSYYQIFIAEKIAPVESRS